MFKKLMFNEKQRESLAKLSYDLIKLVVGGVGISGLMHKDFSLLRIGLEAMGTTVAVTFLLRCAYRLEKDLDEKGRGS